MFLLPDSGIDFDHTDNRSWNASLDGRAIHSFLLWIEPLLDSRDTDEVSPADAARSTPLHRGMRALTEHVARHPNGLRPMAFDWSEASVPVPNGPALAVLATRSTGDAAAASIRLDPAPPTQACTVLDALDVLDEVGLRYLVHLAVGVVVFTDRPHTPAADTPYTVWIHEPPARAVDLAEALVRAAAGAWIDQWLRAEAAARVRLDRPDGVEAAWLSEVLGECLAYQLFDRLAAADGPNPVATQEWRERARASYDELSALRGVLARRLGDTTGFSVVSELVALMYPVWNRRQFATKSPFDYMRSLRPFSDDEKADHRRRWTDPHAVR
ncbi:hypothetical protein [Nocardia sp. R6R-6]|uniref:hypothetical protein n=1 Tax=Nocardia sp. R6R-6 TaxID=3459303 RepID=UPI00403E0ACC